MKCYCTFENRPESQIGLKLLALSLERHCRDFTLCVGVLTDDPGFSGWLRRRAPHAVPVTLPPFRAGSTIWEVKPALLLHLFSLGYTEVTWLDADLIVLRDLAPLLEQLDMETLLIAQEFDYSFAYNMPVIEAYGMEPFRELGGCVNTCLMRVTPRHEPLLRKLLAFMDTPFFREQTGTPSLQQTVNWHHEQTIIELLLTTGSADWTPDTPVHLVPAGSGVIQEMGVTRYSLTDRLRNGLGLNSPWAVHCLGPKPWNPDPRARSVRAASVFCAFAALYRDEVDEPVPWLSATTWSGRVARLASLGQPHWVGIGPCALGRLRQIITGHRDPTAPGLKPNQGAILRTS